MKRLLFLGLTAGIISHTAHAQLAPENFNAGVLPVNWVEISDGHTVSTSFASGDPTIATRLDDSAWINYPLTSATDMGMLTTSYFSPAATADRWLITPSFNVTSADMVIQWDDNDLGSGENIEVWVSPTAVASATAMTTMIYSAPATSGGVFGTHQAAIGVPVGTSVRIGFRDHQNDNWGLGLDNVQTTIINHTDMGVTSLNIPAFIQTGSTHAITGLAHNYGAATTTSMNLDYSINGTIVTPTTSLTGLSIPLGSDYTYTSANNWTPATAGTYVLKVWTDAISSGTDANHANDTFTTTVVVLDSLQPKTVMIEEFTQASCDPCANAAPNVDSVYANNAANSLLVRYHVNFPGRDCMDSVTLAPFVSTRLSYYSVSGVPDAKIDGVDCYPGAGYFTTGVIQGERAQGSPFKILVTPNFNATTQTYSFTATVTSYAALPAGLKLRAVLAVDQLTYAANQSTESIPQFNFPEVAEGMLPNAAGNTLTAFTAGSTQTVSGTWVKNHPWGSDRAVWSYDSTNTGKIIVWVQNDANQYVYQAAYATVSTVYSTGVNSVVVNGGSMDVYPNPASNTTTVALNLNNNADVKMDVYNMAGQLVYSMPVETRNAGTSVSTIDVSNFANGEYLIRVAIGSEVLNKKVTIIK